MASNATWQSESIFDFIAVFLVVYNVRKVAHNEGQGGEVQDDFVIFLRRRMDRRERYDRMLTESIECKRSRLAITARGYWSVTTGSTRWEGMPGVQNMRCVAGT